jgi:glycolate oxidase iron-sulfur subunit
MIEKTNPTSIKCAKCGACTVVCPVYQMTGKESHTARGRLHIFKVLRKKKSRPYADILSKCLLCGACADACPRDIDITEIIRLARHDLPGLAGPLHFKKLLTKKALESPALLDSLGKLQKKLLTKIPKESGLRKHLSLPSNVDEGKVGSTNYQQTGKSLSPQISYFGGCMARYLSPGIETATIRLLCHSLGKPPDIPSTQTCCGLASFSSGNRKEAKKLARINIRAFSDTTHPILTSCASCYTHLKSYPELLANDPEWADAAHIFSNRLREFSSFFHSQLDSLCFKKTRKIVQVFYHDPCHLRFGEEKITETPRRLIQAATGSEIVELQHGPHCCGHGGLFSLAHPDLSKHILQPIITELGELSVRHVVTTCSGCLMQLMKGSVASGLRIPVKHLSQLLNELLEESPSNGIIADEIN